jgi:hypothetical protein
MRRYPILIIILLIILIVPSITNAQIKTRIRVIQASSTGRGIDPSLRDIHGQLGSLFSFTSYGLLKDDIINLSPNSPAIISVHPGRSIEINLLGYRRDAAELRLRIKRDGEEILNTQLRLSSGRTVIIGGPKHGEGVLILAISARF